MRILKLNEMDDFTKDIARDLFNKLPKTNFSESDFIKYMTDKGSSESIAKEVLNHLKNMKFPFTATQTSDFGSRGFDGGDDDFDGFDNDEYPTDPSQWYFDVYKLDDPNAKDYVPCIGLTIEPPMLDDRLGSHNLPKSIKIALDECGVYTKSELQEAIFELKPECDSMTKDEIIRAIEAKGFVYANIF